MSVTLLLRTAVSSLLKRPVTRLAALILPKQTRPEPRIPRDRACIVVVDLSACPYRVRTVCREDRAACAEWHRVTCRCWASHSALQARRDFYGREAVGHGHRHLRSSGHRPRRCRRDLRWRVGQSRVATPEEVRPPTTRPSRAIVLCSLRSPRERLLSRGGASTPRTDPRASPRGGRCGLRAAARPRAVRSGGWR